MLVLGAYFNSNPCHFLKQIANLLTLDLIQFLPIFSSIHRFAFGLSRNCLFHLIYLNLVSLELLHAFKLISLILHQTTSSSHSLLLETSPQFLQPPPSWSCPSPLRRLLICLFLLTAPIISHLIPNTFHFYASINLFQSVIFQFHSPNRWFSPFVVFLMLKKPHDSCSPLPPVYFVQFVHLAASLEQHLFGMKLCELLA